MPRVQIGILAVQGAFAEHAYSLRKAASNLYERQNDRVPRIDVIEVRNPIDVQSLDGLVIPGGESTTMGTFLRKHGFAEAISLWRNQGG